MLPRLVEYPFEDFVAQLLRRLQALLDPPPFTTTYTRHGMDLISSHAVRVILVGSESEQLVIGQCFSYEVLDVASVALPSDSRLKATDDGGISLS